MSIIELNGRSSFDGTDVVFVDLKNGADVYPSPPRSIAGHSHDWPGAKGDTLLTSSWAETATPMNT